VLPRFRAGHNDRRFVRTSVRTAVPIALATHDSGAIAQSGDRREALKVKSMNKELTHPRQREKIGVDRPRPQTDAGAPKTRPARWPAVSLGLQPGASAWGVSLGRQHGASAIDHPERPVVFDRPQANKG
jgi:hypothetical protein